MASYYVFFISCYNILLISKYNLKNLITNIKALKKMCKLILAFNHPTEDCMICANRWLML